MSTALSSLPDVSPPNTGFAAPPSPSPQLPAINRQQKAAIIVRLLLSEGAELSLTDLPEDMQRQLTVQMGSMRSVSRETVAIVVEEFISELDSIGLSFTGGLAGALEALDGKVSANTIASLRKEAGINNTGDPWERLAGMDISVLQSVLEQESIEVGAVLLSKLSVSKAAELLGHLPGERARRITYAVSLTGAVTPEAVQRIGESLVAQLDSQPVGVFDEGPVERVGAILNFSPAATRDDVLAGLEEEDENFANLVKKAIFTFANIPDRIDPRDVPKITRVVDPALLVSALAHAVSTGMQEQADFILNNMSKRMAEQLRDEMQELGTIKAEDGEKAMNAVIASIREMEAAGEILFIAGED